MITAKTKVNIIIGDPVEHSISPQMHNGMYKVMGIDNDFVFIGCTVKTSHLEQAIAGIRALQIHGICVTIPHKIAVMRFLDKIDSHAKTIGAVNTIVNENGKLVGYNTDVIGILESIRAVANVQGKSVAILGAGGAARAAVVAVLSLGATVTIFNRTIEHAKQLAEEFICMFDTIENSEKISKADVIINTTSVGLETTDCPVDKDVFNKNQIVFDVIYTPFETTFLQYAKATGARIIHGTEMFLYQGLAQFTLFTNLPADEKIMRKIIEESIHYEG